MASTLLIERKETRRLMRDANPSNLAVSTRELNRIIEGEMHAVGRRVRLGQAWQTAAITLNTATDPPDYALPATGVQYSQILALRRGYDRRILDKLSQAALQWARRGQATRTGAYVSGYALLEGTDQTVTVMFDVKPTQVDTVDLLRSVIPASFADDDTAVIPFDRDLLEGFRQGCAVRGIAMMNPEQQASRGFAGSVVRGKYVPSAHVQGMAAAYADAVQGAAERVELMKRSGTAVALFARDWFPGGLTPAR